MNTNIFFDVSIGDHQGIPLPDKLTLHNRGDAVEGARLVIRSTSDVLVPFETALPTLDADSATELALQLQLTPGYRTCHMLRTEMVLSVLKDAQVLYSMALRLDVPPQEDNTEQEVNTEDEK